MAGWVNVEQNRTEHAVERNHKGATVRYADMSIIRLLDDASNWCF
jgi:hypothetical protein